MWGNYLTGGSLVVPSANFYGQFLVPRGITESDLWRDVYKQLSRAGVSGVNGVSWH